MKVLIMPALQGVFKRKKKKKSPVMAARRGAAVRRNRGLLRSEALG